MQNRDHMQRNLKTGSMVSINKNITPGQSIRKHCRECCGSAADVKNCGGDKLLSGEPCPLYRYRLGRGRPSVKTIRRECMICMNGQRYLVRHCASVKCNLFKFRFGTNPNHQASKKMPRKNEFNGQFFSQKGRTIPSNGVIA